MKLNIILALVFVNTICASAFATQCQDSAQAITAKELNLEGNTIAEKLDEQNQAVDSESNVLTILNQRSSKYNEIINGMEANEEIISKIFMMNSDDGAVLVARNKNTCELSFKIIIDAGDAVAFDAQILNMTKESVTYKMLQDGIEQTVRISRSTK